jgi:hypothetical protein
MKLKLYKIEDPIYLTNLGLLVGDKDEFNKYLDNLGVPKKHRATGIGYTLVWRDGAIYLIWLSKLENAFNFGTLTHELRHFVDHVFASRGMSVNSGGGEPAAYYTGMLTYNILRKTKLCVFLGSQKSEMNQKSSKKR